MLNARTNSYVQSKKRPHKVENVLICLWSFFISSSLRRNFTKLVSTITLIAFITTTIAADVGWAARTPVELSSVGSAGPGSPAVLKELSVGTFTLPEYLGKINDSWDAKDKTIAIHIQDAHCNYAAQRAITDIISYLNKEYGIRMVNLEGGAQGYDLSMFTKIPDAGLREEISDNFVKEGLINGAEYFAINNPNKVTLWGVEDAPLYIENLNIYRESLKNKEDVDRYLKSLNYILSNLKAKIYSKELLDFDMNYSAYKAGNLQFRDYVEYLRDTARARLIDMAKFANIGLLCRSLEEEKTVDFKKANIERDKLIDQLSKRLSDRSMQDLVMKTVEFKAGRLAQSDFYDYLIGRAKDVALDVSGYEELKKYIAYVRTYKAIDKARVMEELAALETGIKESLYRNDTERRLGMLSKNLVLLKNIFNITLTKSDFRYYQENIDEFNTAAYVKFIESQAPLYKITAMLDPEIVRMDRYREDISRFYDYSLKRDEAFMRNIKFGEGQGSRVQGQGNQVAVIVTGGFHAENLCELFKKNNISYISIMPNFKSSEGYESPYFSLLAGELTGLSKRLYSVLTAIPVAVMAIADMLTSLGKQVWGEEAFDVFNAMVVVMEKFPKDWQKIENIALSTDNAKVEFTFAEGSPQSLGLEEVFPGVAERLKGRAGPARAGIISILSALLMFFVANPDMPVKAGEVPAPQATTVQTVSPAEREAGQVKIDSMVREIGNASRRPELSRDEKELVGGVVQGLENGKPTVKGENYPHVNEKGEIGIPKTSCQDRDMLRAALTHEAMHIYFRMLGIKLSEAEQTEDFKVPGDYWKWLVPGEEGWVIQKTGEVLVILNRLDLQDMKDGKIIGLVLKYEAGGVARSGGEILVYDYEPVSLDRIIELAKDPRIDMFKRAFLVKLLPLIAMNELSVMGAGNPASQEDMAKAEKALKELAEFYPAENERLYERLIRLYPSFENVFRDPAKFKAEFDKAFAHYRAEPDAFTPENLRRDPEALRQSRIMNMVANDFLLGKVRLSEEMLGKNKQVAPPKAPAAPRAPPVAPPATPSPAAAPHLPSTAGVVHLGALFVAGITIAFGIALASQWRVVLPYMATSLPYSFMSVAGVVAVLYMSRRIYDRSVINEKLRRVEAYYPDMVKAMRAMGRTLDVNLPDSKNADRLARAAIKIKLPSGEVRKFFIQQRYIDEQQGAAAEMQEVFYRQTPQNVPKVVYRPGTGTRDLGQMDGRPMETYVMEAVEGKTLADEVDDIYNKYRNDKVRLAAEMAKLGEKFYALGKLFGTWHGSGYQHRDMKLDHVTFIGARPVVIDYGLSSYKDHNTPEDKFLDIRLPFFGLEAMPAAGLVPDVVRDLKNSLLKGYREAWRVDPEVEKLIFEREIGWIAAVEKSPGLSARSVPWAFAEGAALTEAIDDANGALADNGVDLRLKITGEGDGRELQFVQVAPVRAAATAKAYKGIGHDELHAVIREGIAAHPVLQPLLDLSAKTQQEREAVLKEFVEPYSYTDINGVEHTAEVIAITMPPATGFLRKTGLLAHLGLGRYYGRPVIYIDGSITDPEKRLRVIRHELYEIGRWDQKRNSLGLNHDQMREWMRRNPVEAQTLAERWHAETSLAGYGLDDIYNEDPFKFKFHTGRIERAGASAISDIIVDIPKYKNEFKIRTENDLGEIVQDISFKVSYDAAGVELSSDEKGKWNVTVPTDLATVLDDNRLAVLLRVAVDRVQEEEYKRVREGQAAEPVKIQAFTAANWPLGQPIAAILRSASLQERSRDDSSPDLINADVVLGAGPSAAPVPTTPAPTAPPAVAQARTTGFNAYQLVAPEITEFERRMSDPESAERKKLESIIESAVSNFKQSLEDHRKFLASLGGRVLESVSRIEGRTPQDVSSIYYPFGGFDPHTPFGLFPQASDIVSMGSESFGGIDDIRKFYLDADAYDRVGSRYSGADVFRDFGAILSEVGISGLGAVAISRIVSFLGGRVRGLSYFDINDDGSLRYLNEEEIKDNRNCKNAVVEFLVKDPATGKESIKRYWYVQHDIYTGIFRSIFFDEMGLDVGRLRSALVKAGYLDEAGVIQPKMLEGMKAFNPGMELSQDQKAKIFDILLNSYKENLKYTRFTETMKFQSMLIKGANNMWDLTGRDMAERGILKDGYIKTLMSKTVDPAVRNGAFVISDNTRDSSGFAPHSMWNRRPEAVELNDGENFGYNSKYKDSPQPVVYVYYGPANYLIGAKLAPPTTPSLAAAPAPSEVEGPVPTPAPVSTHLKGKELEESIGKVLKEFAPSSAREQEYQKILSTAVYIFDKYAPYLNDEGMRLKADIEDMQARAQKPGFDWKREFSIFKSLMEQVPTIDAPNTGLFIDVFKGLTDEQIQSFCNVGLRTGEGFFPTRSLTVKLTDGCSNQCLICGAAAAGKNLRPMPFPLAVKVLERLAKGSDELAPYFDSDPLDYYDGVIGASIVDVVDVAKAVGFKRNISVVTHGSNFRRKESPELVREIAKRVKVGISIHPYHSNTFYYVVNKPEDKEARERIIEGYVRMVGPLVKAAIDSGGEYEFRVYQPNPEVENMLDPALYETAVKAQGAVPIPLNEKELKDMERAHRILMNMQSMTAEIWRRIKERYGISEDIEKKHVEKWGILWSGRAALLLKQMNVPEPVIRLMQEAAKQKTNLSQNVFGPSIEPDGSANVIMSEDSVRVGRTVERMFGDHRSDEFRFFAKFLRAVAAAREDKVAQFVGVEIRDRAFKERVLQDLKVFLRTKGVECEKMTVKDFMLLNDKMSDYMKFLLDLYLSPEAKGLILKNPSRDLSGDDLAALFVALKGVPFLTSTKFNVMFDGKAVKRFKDLDSVVDRGSLNGYKFDYQFMPISNKSAQERDIYMPFRRLPVPMMTAFAAAPAAPPTPSLAAAPVPSGVEGARPEPVEGPKFGKGVIQPLKSVLMLVLGRLGVADEVYDFMIAPFLEEIIFTLIPMIVFPHLFGAIVAARAIFVASHLITESTTRKILAALYLIPKSAVVRPEERIPTIRERLAAPFIISLVIGVTIYFFSITIPFIGFLVALYVHAPVNVRYAWIAKDARQPSILRKGFFRIYMDFALSPSFPRPDIGFRTAAKIDRALRRELLQRGIKGDLLNDHVQTLMIAVKKQSFMEGFAEEVLKDDVIRSIGRVVSDIESSEELRKYMRPLLPFLFQKVQKGQLQAHLDAVAGLIERDLFRGSQDYASALVSAILTTDISLQSAKGLLADDLVLKLYNFIPELEKAGVGRERISSIIAAVVKIYGSNIGQNFARLIYIVPLIADACRSEKAVNIDHHMETVILSILKRTAMLGSEESVEPSDLVKNGIPILVRLSIKLRGELERDGVEGEDIDSYVEAVTSSTFYKYSYEELQEEKVVALSGYYWTPVRVAALTERLQSMGIERQVIYEILRDTANESDPEKAAYALTKLIDSLATENIGTRDIVGIISSITTSYTHRDKVTDIGDAVTELIGTLRLSGTRKAEMLHIIDAVLAATDPVLGARVFHNLGAGATVLELRKKFLSAFSRRGPLRLYYRRDGPRFTDAILASLLMSRNAVGDMSRLVARPDAFGSVVELIETLGAAGIDYYYSAEILSNIMRHTVQEENARLFVTAFKSLKKALDLSGTKYNVRLWARDMAKEIFGSKDPRRYLEALQEPRAVSAAVDFGKSIGDGALEWEALTPVFLTRDQPTPLLDVANEIVPKLKKAFEGADIPIREARPLIMLFVSELLNSDDPRARADMFVRDDLAGSIAKIVRSCEGFIDVEKFKPCLTYLATREDAKATADVMLELYGTLKRLAFPDPITSLIVLFKNPEPRENMEFLNSTILRFEKLLKERNVNEGDAARASADIGIVLFLEVRDHGYQAARERLDKKGALEYIAYLTGLLYLEAANEKDEGRRKDIRDKIPRIVKAMATAPKPEEFARALSDIFYVASSEAVKMAGILHTICASEIDAAERQRLAIASSVFITRGYWAGLEDITGLLKLILRKDQPASVIISYAAFIPVFKKALESQGLDSKAVRDTMSNVLRTIVEEKDTLGTIERFMGSGADQVRSEEAAMSVAVLTKDLDALGAGLRGSVIVRIFKYPDPQPMINVLKKVIDSMKTEFERQGITGSEAIRIISGATRALVPEDKMPTLANIEMVAQPGYIRSLASLAKLLEDSGLDASKVQKILSDIVSIPASKQSIDILSHLALELKGANAPADFTELLIGNIVAARITDAGVEAVTRRMAERDESKVFADDRDIKFSILLDLMKEISDRKSKDDIPGMNALGTLCYRLADTCDPDEVRAGLLAAETRVHILAREFIDRLGYPSGYIIAERLKVLTTIFPRIVGPLLVEKERLENADPKIRTHLINTIQALDEGTIAHLLKVDLKLATYLKRRGGVTGYQMTDKKTDIERVILDPDFRRNITGITHELNREVTLHPVERRVGEDEKTTLLDHLFAVSDIGRARNIFDEYFMNNPELYRIRVIDLNELLTYLTVEEMEMITKAIIDNPKESLEEIRRTVAQKTAGLRNSEFILRKMEWILSNLFIFRMGILRLRPVANVFMQVSETDLRRAFKEAASVKGLVPEDLQGIYMDIEDTGKLTKDQFAVVLQDIVSEKRVASKEDIQRVLLKSLLRAIDNAKKFSVLVEIAKKNSLALADVMRLKLETLSPDAREALLLEGLESLAAYDSIDKKRLTDQEKERDKKEMRSQLALLGKLFDEQPERSRIRIYMGILCGNYTKQTDNKFLAKILAELQRDVMTEPDRPELLTTFLLGRSAIVRLNTALGKFLESPEAKKVMPSFRDLYRKRQAAAAGALAPLSAQIAFPETKWQLPHVLLEPILTLSKFIEPEESAFALKTLRQLIIAMNENDEIRDRLATLKNDLIDNINNISTSAYEERSRLLAMILKVLVEKYKGPPTAKNARQFYGDLITYIGQYIKTADTYVKAQKNSYEPELNKRFNDLSAEILTDLLKNGRFNEEKLRELMSELANRETSTLLAQFKSILKIEDEKELLARFGVKDEADLLDKLKRYALTDRFKRLDHKTRNVYELMRLYLQGVSDVEIYRNMLEALLAEVMDGLEGTTAHFRAWKYSSDDYLRTIDGIVRIGAQRLLSAEELMRFNEALEKAEGVTAYDKLMKLEGFDAVKATVNKIKDGWEGELSYRVFDNDASFTDDFYTLFNLGNSEHFSSCQSCAEGGYRRGLSGYVSNGTNKAIVFFDEKGGIMTRRVVRLRIAEIDGKMQPVIFVEENSQFRTEAIDNLYGMLDILSQRTGLPLVKPWDVSKEKMREGDEAHVALMLFRGRAKYDYSDNYGKLISSADGNLGVGLFRQEKPEMAVPTDLHVRIKTPTEISEREIERRYDLVRPKRKEAPKPAAPQLPVAAVQPPAVVGVAAIIAGAGAAPQAGVPAPGAGARKNIIDNDEQLTLDEMPILIGYASTLPQTSAAKTINGVPIKYELVTYARDTDVDRFFKRKGVEGAFNLADPATGTTYVFVQEGLSDYDIALEHEEYEIYWKKMFETGPPIEFDTERASHILAWASQIALRRWASVNDSAFIQGQLQRIKDSPDALRQIYEADREPHHKLIRTYLPNSAERVIAFEKSVSDLARGLAAEAPVPPPAPAAPMATIADKELRSRIDTILKRGIDLFKATVPRLSFEKAMQHLLRAGHKDEIVEFLLTAAPTKAQIQSLSKLEYEAGLMRLRGTNIWVLRSIREAHAMDFRINGSDAYADIFIHNHPRDTRPVASTTDIHSSTMAVGQSNWVIGHEGVSFYNTDTLRYTDDEEENVYADPGMFTKFIPSEALITGPEISPDTEINKAERVSAYAKMGIVTEFLPWDSLDTTSLERNSYHFAEALRSPIRKVRYWAFDQIKEIGSADEIIPLAGLFSKDESAAVQRAALEYIEKHISLSASIDALKAFLDSPNLEIQLRALRILAQHGILDDYIKAKFDSIVKQNGLWKTLSVKETPSSYEAILSPLDGKSLTELSNYITEKYGERIKSEVNVSGIGQIGYGTTECNVMLRLGMAKLLSDRVENLQRDPTAKSLFGTALNALAMSSLEGRRFVSAYINAHPDTDSGILLEIAKNMYSREDTFAMPFAQELIAKVPFTYYHSAFCNGDLDPGATKTSFFMRKPILVVFTNDPNPNIAAASKIMIAVWKKHIGESYYPPKREEYLRLLAANGIMPDSFMMPVRPRAPLTPSLAAAPVPKPIAAEYTFLRDENYRELLIKTIERTLSYAREKNIRTVFAPGRSARPAALLFQLCWQKLYPDEPVPEIIYLDTPSRRAFDEKKIAAEISEKMRQKGAAAAEILSQPVLIIDDVIETGETLEKTRSIFKDEIKAREVYTAALFLAGDAEAEDLRAIMPNVVLDSREENFDSASNWYWVRHWILGKDFGESFAKKVAEQKYERTPEQERKIFEEYLPRDLEKLSSEIAMRMGAPAPAPAADEAFIRANLMVHPNAQPAATEEVMKKVVPVSFKPLTLTADTAKGEFPAQLQIDAELLAQLDPQDRADLVRMVTANVEEKNDVINKIINNKEPLRPITFDLKHVDFGGRSGHLVLRKPVVILGKTIRMLRFKGIMPQPKSKGSNEIAPYKSGPGVVDELVMVSAEDPRKLVVGPARTAPQGVMGYQDALQEFYAMERFAGMGLTDLAVGIGTYDNLGFRGEKVGFVICGVEDNQDERFMAIDRKVIPITDADNHRLAYELGRQLRSIHDAGYMHYFPHALNFGVVRRADGLHLVMRDLDNVYSIADLPVEAQISYRYHDITRILWNLYFGSNTAFGEASPTSSPFMVDVLKGYFADRPDAENVLTMANATTFIIPERDLLWIESSEGDTYRSYEEVSITASDPDIAPILKVLETVAREAQAGRIAREQIPPQAPRAPPALPPTPAPSEVEGPVPTPAPALEIPLRGGATQPDILAIVNAVKKVFEDNGYKMGENAATRFCDEMISNALRARLSRILSDKYGSLDKVREMMASGLTEADMKAIDDAEKQAKAETEVTIQCYVHPDSIRLVVNNNTELNDDLRGRVEAGLVKKTLVQAKDLNYYKLLSKPYFTKVFGSGLGLPLTREQVATAGATMSYKSAAGQTTFAMELKKPAPGPLVSPQEEFYGSAGKLVPAILSVVNKGAPTFSVSPAVFEDISPLTGVDRSVERILGKAGHTIRAKHYAIGADEASSITNMQTQVGKMLPDFNRSVLESGTTRFMIRVLSKDMKAKMEKYIEDELRKLNTNTRGEVDAWAVNNALAKIRVIVVDARDAKHLNAVVDLFVDISMMEYDRYGKPDGYAGEPTPEFKEDLASLLRQSVTNLADVRGNNIDETIKKIFKADIILIIRAIDWKSLQQWKAAQDAVLKSL